MSSASLPQFIVSYTPTAETKVGIYKRELEAWAEDQGLLLRYRNSKLGFRFTNCYWPRFLALVLT